jgi:hypothetical protein
MSSEWGDLENGLAGLDGEVSGADLPGPDAARTRARQRTRRRTASVALAAVVVLAGGGLAVGQLAGVNSAEVQPAGPSDGSPTPTEPAPTTSPDDGDPTESPDVDNEPPVAFLDPDELSPMIDPADGSEVTWVGSDDPLPDLGLDTCATPDFDLGGDRRWYIPERPVSDFSDIAPNDADGGRWDGATQLIVEPGDPAQAFQVLRDSYQGCASTASNDPDVGQVAGYVDAPFTGIGDDAYIVGLLIETEDDEFGRTMLVGVARTGDYVTVVIRQDARQAIGPLSGRDAITPMGVDLAAAVNKLCELPDGGECATDPVFDDPIFEDPEIDPELHELADEPLLTDDDVNPVGTYDGFVRSESTGPSDTLYDLLCLSEFSAADGERTETGGWNHDSGAWLTEVVRETPEDGSATALIETYESLPDQCGEQNEGREQTVNQPQEIAVGGADQARAWTVTTEPIPDDLGTEPFFGGVGMARNANIIVVITFAASGDPTEGTDGEWKDYATRTLAAALVRAIAE